MPIESSMANFGAITLSDTTATMDIQFMDSGEFVLNMRSFPIPVLIDDSLRQYVSDIRDITMQDSIVYETIAPLNVLGEAFGVADVEELRSLSQAFMGRESFPFEVEMARDAAPEQPLELVRPSVGDSDVFEPEKVRESIGAGWAPEEPTGFGGEDLPLPTSEFDEFDRGAELTGRMSLGAPVLPSLPGTPATPAPSELRAQGALFGSPVVGLRRVRKRKVLIDDIIEITTRAFQQQLRTASQDLVRQVCLTVDGY